MAVVDGMLAGRRGADGLPAGAAYALDWSTVSGDCDASGYQAPEGRGAKKIKLTADTVSGGLTIYTK